MNEHEPSLYRTPVFYSFISFRFISFYTKLTKNGIEENKNDFKIVSIWWNVKQLEKNQKQNKTKQMLVRLTLCIAFVFISFYIASMSTSIMLLKMLMVCYIVSLCESRVQMCQKSFYDSAWFFQCADKIYTNTFFLKLNSIDGKLASGKRPYNIRAAYIGFSITL